MRDSWTWLQLMADSLPVLISYVDRQQRYRFNNAEYERWFGMPSESYLGRTVRQVLGARAYVVLKPHIEAALAGQVRSFELQVPYRGAGIRDVQVDYVPHRDAAGAVAGFFALIRDVTEERVAMEKLRRSEESLAKAQEIAHVGSYEYSASDDVPALWSLEVFRILGRSPGAAMSFDEYLHKVVHPDDFCRIAKARHQIIHHHVPLDIQYRIVQPNGSTRWVRSIGRAVMNTRGKVDKVVGVIMDISDRMRLEKEILEASEMERRRIAQDLHDGLGQCLAGTRYLAASLHQNLKNKAAPEAGEAHRILDLLSDSVAQARALARGLYPVRNEPEGLTAALEELAERTRDIYRVDCEFACGKPIRLPDNSTATHLYRIAQEAVNNAIRHGKARRVWISLRAYRRHLALIIEDIGKGIGSSRRGRNGMGIRTMYYRAEMLSGSLAIVPRPGGGTRVSCQVPWPEQKGGMDESKTG